eukprot:4974203-Ditylum_brightwellii.AAC.1
MDPNNVAIVDVDYGTSVLIQQTMVTVLHKETGQRLRATILIEGRDGNSVLYHIRWVECPVNIAEWEAVVPRRNARRIVIM